MFDRKFFARFAGLAVLASSTLNSCGCGSDFGINRVQDPNAGHQRPPSINAPVPPSGS